MSKELSRFDGLPLNDDSLRDELAQLLIQRDSISETGEEVYLLLSSYIKVREALFVGYYREWNTILEDLYLHFGIIEYYQNKVDELLNEADEDASLLKELPS
jgi:hypothetical protein